MSTNYTGRYIPNSKANELYCQVCTDRYIPIGAKMEKDHSEGVTLMNLRERAGLTRRQLASAVGVTEKTIYVWESSEKEPKMTPSQIESYIAAVGCSFEEFTRSIKVSIGRDKGVNESN